MPVYNSSNDPRQAMGSKPKKKVKGNKALRHESMGEPVTPRQKKAAKAAARKPRKTPPAPPTTVRQQKAIAARSRRTKAVGY